MAVNMSKDFILTRLAELNKLQTLPHAIKNFVTAVTQPYGKAKGSSLLKVLLINKKYFVEAQSEDAL